MKKSITIKTEYTPTLGAFLDETGINWRYDGDIITFDLPYTMTNSELFAFAMKAAQYANKHSH